MRITIESEVMQSQAALPTLTTHDLDGVKQLIATDRAAVDRLIESRLGSDVELINHLGSHIINSGGKRLRPMISLLAARACDYQGDQHLALAAIIEFIHTATLLHDDVVDGSLLRRGNQTANAVWGNQASVLVGDFLYSRAFQMMVEIGNMRVMRIMADTTNTIAEGEVMQLLNSRNPDTTEEKYLAANRCKTAKLFEAAAQAGAVISSADPAMERALTDFGISFGVAYQLLDDVLDYSASAEQMGKNVGDDLAEGKPTLPLIHAMRTGTDTQRAMIRKAIEQGGREMIDDVLAAIESTRSIAYTQQVAMNEANKAIAALKRLPCSEYRDAMEALTEFCISRNF